MYDLYMTMWRDTSGWWWGAFGDDGQFTIWDFMSATSYYEAGGLTEYSATLGEAGVRWYYGSQCPISQSCGTAEDIINWWGAYSQSAAGLYNSTTRGGKTLDEAFYLYKGRAPSEMNNFGEAFHHPPEEWKTGWASDRPYGWGNMGWGIFSPNAEKMFRMYPKSLFASYDGWVILSGCAWLNWQRFGNKMSCPPVR